MASLKEMLVSFVLILEMTFSLLILLRVILSWVSRGRRGGGNLDRFVYESTEPIIRIARKIPHRVDMFDFAPIIALIGMSLVSQLLVILISGL